MKLYNQDCQDILPHILETLDRKKVIFVSDPPFNVGYHFNEYNGNLEEEEYFEALESVFEGDKCVLIHYPEQLYKFSFQIGMFPEKVISWVYNSNAARQHRDIAFFGIKPNMKQVRQLYKNPNSERKRGRTARGFTGTKIYDWWNINQVKNVSKEKTEHPYQIPLKVMENIIGLLPYDAIIIDPFMGSGTTGLAVLNMNLKQNANRDFIGIEIDEKYFDIAKKRIEKVENQMSIFDYEIKGGLLI